jgi:hypothetical protein
MRCEAQAQPSLRRMQRLFELDARKLDFVSITPWQARWLIAKMAVPSQRRLQWESSLLHERDHVVYISWLFRNANAQESKQNPAKKGSGGCKKKASDSFKEDSSQDENSYEYEKRRKKNVGRSISRDRGMQAEYDAASKRRGNRYGWQPHGTLRNLTSVSM